MLDDAPDDAIPERPRVHATFVKSPPTPDFDVTRVARDLETDCLLADDFSRSADDRMRRGQPASPEEFGACADTVRRLSAHTRALLRLVDDLHRARAELNDLHEKTAQAARLWADARAFLFRHGLDADHYVAGCPFLPGSDRC